MIPSAHGEAHTREEQGRRSEEVDTARARALRDQKPRVKSRTPGPPGPRPAVKDRKKPSSAPREPASESAKSEQPSSSDTPVDAPVGSSDSKAEAPTKASYDQRTANCCLDCLQFHVKCTTKDDQLLGECRGSTPSLGHLIAREQIKGMGIPRELQGRPWGRYPLMAGNELACAAFKPRMAEKSN